MKNLLELDLSHNEIKDSFIPLIEQVRDNCQFIHTLSLASCPSVSEIDQPLTFEANPVIGGFRYLKRLDLSSSLNGDEQAIEFSQSTCFRQLELLKLRNCFIMNDGF